MSLLSKSRGFIRFLLAFTVLAAPGALVAQNYVVCPKAGITLDGIHTAFLKSMDRTHKKCGPLTNDLGKVKIFISSEEGYLFVGSNYKSRLGYGMKLAGTGDISLKDAVANLVGGFDSGRYSEEFQEAYPNIPIFLDDSLASGRAAKWLTLDSEASIFYIDNNGKTWKTKSGDFGKRVLHYTDHVVAKIPSMGALRSAALRHSALAKIRLKQDVGVINLIVDRDASAQIGQKIPDKVLGRLDDPAGNLANIASLIDLANNKLVVVIAHLEGDQIVVRDYDGKRLGSMPVKEFDRLCAQSKVDVLMIGCWAGRLSEMTGPTSKIHAEDAISRLAVALRKRTALQMLDALSVPQSRSGSPWTIAVDSAFLTRRSGFDATAFLMDSDLLASGPNGPLPIHRQDLGKSLLRIRYRFNSRPRR